jgi:hypothetical protein
MSREGWHFVAKPSLSGEQHEFLNFNLGPILSSKSEQFYFQGVVLLLFLSDSAILLCCEIAERRLHGLYAWQQKEELPVASKKKQQHRMVHIYRKSCRYLMTICKAGLILEGVPSSGFIWLESEATTNPPTLTSSEIRRVKPWICIWLRKV